MAKTKTRTAAKSRATKPKSAKPKAATKPKAAKPKAAKPKAAEPKAAKPRAAEPRVIEVPGEPADDRKPDAPPGVVVTHARKLANLVRADAAALAVAKVSVADADQLVVLADSLDKVQQEWNSTRDEQGQGAVAKLRAPLRTGRDHLFSALRTFAEGNKTTQRALDDIGGVDDDEDLTSDTARLLVLARKHRKDLDGTDVTAERIAGVEKSLAAFKEARGGARNKESGDQTTSQSESEQLRRMRRARNRAFWQLADLVRRVCRRGQYAFRDDKAKRAKYNLYRSGTVAGPEEQAEPAS